MLRFALFVYVLFAANTHAAPCLPTFEQAAYAACVASLPCSEAMNLAEISPAYFNTLLQSVLVVDLQIPDLTYCANAETFDILIALLTNYPFCGTNELIDEDEVCVCAPNLNCDPVCPDTASSTVTLIIASVVFIALLIWLTVRTEKNT